MYGGTDQLESMLACRVLISTVGFQHTFIITAIVKLVRT